MNEKVNEKVGTCGCGRSPTGDCIGWHALSQEEFEKKQQAHFAEANKPTNQ